METWRSKAALDRRRRSEFGTVTCNIFGSTSVDGLAIRACNYCVKNTLVNKKFTLDYFLYR